MQMQAPLTAVTSVIDGLKRLYIEKLKPLEVAYRFNDFATPLLVYHLCSHLSVQLEMTIFSHHDNVHMPLFAHHWIYCSIFQTNSDFDAKPMVTLLGQYSTGKTTFIKHMLKTSYPGLVLSTPSILVVHLSISSGHNFSWSLQLQELTSDQNQLLTDL